MVATTLSALPPRLLDQRHMSSVERAHRRHERQALAACTQGYKRCGELTRLTDRLQGFSPFGKRLTGARFLEPRGKSARGVGTMAQPHFIVFANEKGGTGKSTTAVHTAIALAATGHSVAALDLDSRQRTMTRYLENRDATMRRLNAQLPQARYKVLEDQTLRGAGRGAPRAERRAPTSSSSTRPAAMTRSPARRSSRPTLWSRR